MAKVELRASEFFVVGRLACATREFEAGGSLLFLPSFGPAAAPEDPQLFIYGDKPIVVV